MARPSTTTPRPVRGSSFELSTRVRAAWGEEGWQALVGSGWGDEFRLDGDPVVFWVTRIERRGPSERNTPSSPDHDEYPQYFDGRSFRDAPLGPERLGRIVGSLSLDLANPAVQASVLSACTALVGPVIRTPGEARALTGIDGLDAQTSKLVADDDAITLFEPPHLEDRAFVFCVNLGHDPKSRGPAFLRFAVDTETLGLSTTFLCRGRADRKP